MDLDRETQTYVEAMQSKGWQEAIASKIESIKKNQTWQVVDLPDGYAPSLQNGYLRKKKDALGEVRKLKARRVSKGYEQVHGEKIYETFALVVRWSTIRTTLTVVARKRWKLKQLDVKTTFLNGMLGEEVYMELPEGFREPRMEGKVVRLKRALYGLTQAPRAWNTRIDTFVVEVLGIVKNTIHPNLYNSIINGKYTIFFSMLMTLYWRGIIIKRWTR